MEKNFYSHIPCGMWRTSGAGAANYSCYFYSHIPCGMWPNQICFARCRVVISTHTSRVGCDLVIRHAVSIRNISTHTSRVGCDFSTWFLKYFIIYFYSHIPCGMWPSPELYVVASETFLLTHPVWDVTELHLNSRRGMKFLLTHPVWDVTSSR